MYSLVQGWPRSQALVQEIHESLGTRSEGTCVLTTADSSCLCKHEYWYGCANLWGVVFMEGYLLHA